MLKLYYREQFYKDLEDIKDKTLRERIVKKTLEFENRDEPLGKKLEGVPYWSVRVGNYRVIFEKKGQDIDFYRILARKFKYRELR
jgi:mRNA-degrading endonuclease RelE of RelBE toxin-antitoxin system